MASGTLHEPGPRLRRTPLPATPARGRRRGALVVVVVAVAVVVGGLAIAAFTLSGVHLSDDPAALARVGTGPLAGEVRSVRAFSPSGRPIPLSVRDGRLTPAPGLVAPGEPVTVEVVVRRPGAVAWLLGAQDRERLTITAPAAQIGRRHLIVPPGSPVRVSFDQPVRVVSVAPAGGRAAVRRLAPPEPTLKLGIASVAGSVTVAAAPRRWERPGAPQQVTWFAPSRGPAVVSDPPPSRRATPTGELRLTFSVPVDRLLGSGRPAIAPAVPGRWLRPDPYTLAFLPAGTGLPLGTRVAVTLPNAVGPVTSHGIGAATRTLTWTVRTGTPLRLHQLLARAGYLPLVWTPSGRPVARTVRAEVAAAVQPPAGHFSWRYPNVPSSLRAMWSSRHANSITQGAVMAFENDHGLTADGFAGAQVWRALIRADIAGRRRHGGYSYVYVHRDTATQTMTLWHDGHTIVTSPTNTGVPSAPTQLGTFPVFEHLRVTTMTGNNPDGSHYSDPGIQWVSYFNGGDALHAFDRASFGTPQSDGCVELPLGVAAQIWPYTPIGTLVTIEH